MTSPTVDDPFELHASWFLTRFRELSKEFYAGLGCYGDVAADLAKYWPQILVAFSWAAEQRAASKVAAEFCNAFMTIRMAGGLPVLPPQRSAVETEFVSVGLSATALSHAWAVGSGLPYEGVDLQTMKGRLHCESSSDDALD